MKLTREQEVVLAALREADTELTEATETLRLATLQAEYLTELEALKAEYRFRLHDTIEHPWHPPALPYEKKPRRKRTQ